MKKLLILGFTIVLFTISLAFTGFATAFQSQDLLGEETEITGMVEQDGATFILQDIDGDEYMMTGQNLSNMVGKKVHAIGELIREQDHNKFNINEIVELEDERLSLNRDNNILLYMDAENYTP